MVEPEGGSPGATHPAGFLAAGVVAGLKESGRPDMGVLAVAPQSREQSASAAVFTTNAFAAAPLVLARAVCDLGGLVAVVMNSGTANACTGSSGLAAAGAEQSAGAQELGIGSDKVAVGSTGVIGRQADAPVMAAGAGKAAEAVRSDGGPDFNQAIMTTDRFPKICAVDVDIPGGTVRLGVCGKGAGMIAPAMATMLCVVTTDAVLTATEMGPMLDAAVGGSLNRVTVDGEMSTNDAVVFLASGASGVRPDETGLARISEALEAMLLRVALMMVADGEGATKVMRLKVQGADTEKTADAVARAIGDSPLVKTAMNGADANWGRIMSAAGAALAGRSVPETALWLCGVKVVEKATACALRPADVGRLAAGMKGPEIDILLDLGSGDCSTEIYFADLGHEYITVNAEYHT